MQEYEIEFYDKADGSEPVKEFILSLDKKMQAKVLRTVALLREEGPCLRDLLKLNSRIFLNMYCIVKIQIQHLLKLNNKEL